MILNRYLIDLAAAFQRVSIDDYNWWALNRHEIPYLQEAENNFTAEIYRHLRNMMVHPDNWPYYKDLGFKLHFDVRKARVHMQPDLVLHFAPDDHQPHNQIFFVEVKTTHVAIIDDLDKLRRAISNELNFQHGVMIVINNSLNDTLDYITEFVGENNILLPDLKKLYLYHSAIDPENNNRLKFYYSDFYSIVGN